MEKYIDLHAHTNCSDGSCTPEEMVRLAKEAGLAAVAITDHDTLNGIEEALEAGEKYGICVVPGVELSTKYEGRSVHIVGLFPDRDSQVLNDTVRRIFDARHQRNLMMISRLAELHYEIDPDKYDLPGDVVLTRGNIGQMLVNAGYFENIQQTFDQLLEKGKPAYIPKWSPGAEEGIDILHQAGAVAIIAHYHKIFKKDREKSRQAAEYLIGAGADGLEVRYSDFTEADRRTAEEIAAKYGCLRSGGSDFHGLIKPGLRIGTGYGDLRVPYEFLEKIMESRQS